MFTLYFDGSCEPKNPGGVATAGWLINDEYGNCVASDSRYIREGKGSTNNVAEYCALGFALRWLLDNHIAEGADLVIYGDSKLVIEQISLNWKCKSPHLKRLRDRCREILSQLKLMSWRAQWIPREQNGEADTLSRQAYITTTGKTFPRRVHRLSR